MLRYNAFYDQWFDTGATNPYTPSAECWPTEKSEFIQTDVRQQLQRLGSLLGIKTGLFNVEWRVSKNGKVYLMEVSPRAGGNRLAEILNYATDVDIIEAEVCKAISEPLPDVHEPNYNGHYSILVLHSDKEGTFAGIEVNGNYQQNIVETEIRIRQGEKVESFSGANNAIGTLFLRFENREKMDEALARQKDWLTINVDSCIQ